MEKFRCRECGKLELEVNAIIVNSVTRTGLEYKVKLCSECAFPEGD